MSIWNLDTITESYDFEDTGLMNEVEAMSSDYLFEGTSEESDMILWEGATDIYKCESALYIADTFIERTMVTEGYEAAEVMLENVVKKAAGSVVDALKRLWAKITSWFKGVIESIQNAVGIGRGFVVKYRASLSKVDVKAAMAKREKGIAAFPYTKATIAEAKKKADAVHSKSMSLIDGMKSAVGGGGKYDSAEAFESSIGDLAVKTKDELISGLISAAGFSNAKSIGEVKHDIEVTGRGGVDAKEELTAANIPSMEEMMSFVDGYDKTVSEVKAHQKQMDAMFKSAIGAFSGIEKRAANDDKLKGKFGSSVSKLNGNVNAVINLNQNATNGLVAVYKGAFNSYLHVMKALLGASNKKDKKEENLKESSLFDDIMNSL